jgi:hypothetical protein
MGGQTLIDIGTTTLGGAKSSISNSPDGPPLAQCSGLDKTRQAGGDVQLQQRRGCT